MDGGKLYEKRGSVGREKGEKENREKRRKREIKKGRRKRKESSRKMGGIGRYRRNSNGEKIMEKKGEHVNKEGKEEKEGKVKEKGGMDRPTRRER